MKILYLSGAPRVSTKAISSCQGPRAHVLGVIGGFEQLGYPVDQLIIGDQVPERMITSNFEPQKEVSKIKQTALLVLSDIIRLFIRMLIILKGKMTRASNRPDLVYERYGLFMGLGNFLKSQKGYGFLNPTLSYHKNRLEIEPLFFLPNGLKNQRKMHITIVTT